MKQEQFWHAVADPTRRCLIELLRDGPRTTGALCRPFSTTRFAVMKHLGVLERSGVITVRRSGRERWNALNPEAIGLLEGRPTGGLATGALSQVGTCTEAVIDAPPWRVFDALTVNVASWWGAPHLRAADASNLVLEPQPGGRFIEEWGHRQGVLRGTVTAIRQDERLELTGTVLGAGRAVLDIRLERREGGTLLSASVSREQGGGAEDEADHRALDDLLKARLKAFVEHGTRSGVMS
jgi:DNA-binding transcriptional ArsR family regulator